jgi:hypothetical protein
VITLTEYFQKPHSKEQEEAAADLLSRRNALRAEWDDAYPVNPYTGTEISGSINGDGDGGFRTPGSRAGAPNSAHKTAQAVDDYDPGDEFDRWLDQFEGPDGTNSKLEQYGLYREAPEDTPNWCHLTTRAPPSGRRTFKP